MIDCEVYIAEETYDKYVLANKMMRLPMWVENTLKEAYATEILDDGSDEDDDDGKGGEKEQKDGEEGDDDGQETRSIVSVDLGDSSLCSQGCRPEREQLDGYDSHGIF